MAHVCTILIAPMKVFVIIPAAGLGTRMAPPSAAKAKKKAAPTKQFKELGGVPILVHTLRVFANTPAVYEIVVALRKNEIAGFRNQLEKQFPEILNKRLQIVEGGEHRQNSVANAMANLAADPEDLVLVHDAVRPFVTPYSILHVIEAAAKTPRGHRRMARRRHRQAGRANRRRRHHQGDDPARQHRHGADPPGLSLRHLEEGFR